MAWRTPTVRVAGAALAVAYIALAPHTGRTHHVVSQYGIAPAEPVTRTSLQLEVRRFNFDDGGPTGTAGVLTPRVQYAPTEWLSGQIRLPVAHVDYASRSPATGIGDLSLAVRTRLHASPHGKLLVSTGLGAEFPTGNPENGLGAGHVELAPFVVASSRVAPDVILFGSLTQQLSLGSPSTGADEGDGHTHSHDHHSHDHSGDITSVHGAVVAPHRDYETRNRVGAAYVVDPLYVSARATAVFAWTRAKIFGPLEASAEVGWRPLSSLSLALSAGVPVIGPRRYSWKASLSGSWRF